MKNLIENEGPDLSSGNQKGPEQALESPEDIYRVIVNTIPDGLILIEQGRVTFVSDRACLILGYPRERLLEMDGMELAAPEERYLAKAFLDPLSRSGQAPAEVDFWILRPDGERRYIRNRYTRLQDAQGRQKHLVLITDITERKHTEDALRESAASYQELFDDVPVGLYRTTPGGQILDANRALVEMLGYPDRDTLLKVNAVDMFVHPGDRQQEMDLLDRAGGVLNYTELQLRRYDGQVIWVRDTVRSVRHKQEEVSYYDGSLEDITERKAAEGARSLLASIVESSLDAIIGMDLEGRIVSWNSGAEQIFGYSAAEVVGRPASLLAPAHLSDELPRLLGKIRRGGRIEQYETVQVRKGGQEIQVSLSLSPIQDKNGRIIGASKIARDISLQKQMEQVTMRAERLAAMGQVSASLAHEVKNPLQAIQSNLELVRDFPLEPDEREECLRICTREVEQLLDITQRMLSFARTERQTVRPVSLQKIWDQALALLGKALETASVKLHTDFPEGLLPVMAVEDQIGQVLVNLVLNAIEAMPNGGNLSVTARQEGGRLVLSLLNSGPSIPAEQIERIFDPFFTTKPEGTGLGLFVSHSIVQQHGGILEVENLPDGRGVVFTLSLPVLLKGEVVPRVDEAKEA